MFDRAPDSAGLAFWTAALNRGTSLDAISDLFVASQEFQARNGTLADPEFVRLLYRNGLEREAEPAGLDLWSGGLQRAATDRGDVASDISESPEGVASALTPGVGQPGTAQPGTGQQTVDGTGTTGTGTQTGTQTATPGTTAPATDGTGTGTWSAPHFDRTPGAT